MAKCGKQKTKVLQFTLSGSFTPVKSPLLRVVSSLTLSEMEERHHCNPNRP